jgi:drug/metabolite transporter (DMT)-like permease
LSLLAYVTPVYTTAAVFLLLFALVAGVPLAGYGTQTILACVLLALGPQLIGHSSINWSLGYLSPAFVTVAILGEPIGSAVLALILFREVPPLATLAGGVLILVGIYVSSREERARLSE